MAVKIFQIAHLSSGLGVSERKQRKNQVLLISRHLYAVTTS